MRWPFVLRKVHELEVVNRDAVIELIARNCKEAQAQAEYWRVRAERLTDAALARKGEIHEPTFVERKPAPASPLAAMARSMGVKEIDSTKSVAG
jgi:hypothetical protein